MPSSDEHLTIPVVESMIAVHVGASESVVLSHVWLPAHLMAAAPDPHLHAFTLSPSTQAVNSSHLVEESAALWSQNSVEPQTLSSHVHRAPFTMTPSVSPHAPGAGVVQRVAVVASTSQ
jgi:hypothetical protein